MKSNPTTILQRQHELLVRHCALGTLAPLDDLLAYLKPSWCHKLVPVLVPQLADGQAYRRFLVDAHADLAKQEIKIDEQIPDDAFCPEHVHGVRFTIDEYHWRRQSEIAEQFRKGVVERLSLFANVFHILDLCTAHNVPDAIAHPMWSSAVSYQAAVVYPRTSKVPTVFVRSESIADQQKTKFGLLVISEQMCRESLAPFYLPDLRML